MLSKTLHVISNLLKIKHIECTSIDRMLRIKIAIDNLSSILYALGFSTDKDKQLFRKNNTALFLRNVAPNIRIYDISEAYTLWLNAIETVFKCSVANKSAICFKYKAAANDHKDYYASLIAYLNANSTKVEEGTNFCIFTYADHIIDVFREDGGRLQMSVYNG